MEKYFIVHNGIQKGPWSIDDISANLKNNEIVWNDYIYDETTEEWVLLLEFPKLTFLFNKSFTNPINEIKPVKETLDPIKDRAWYILKQNNNYGPFSQSEMVQMLQSKTLFEFDFVWKKGLESWKRLADIEEFKPENIKDLYQTFSKDINSEMFFRRRHERVEYSSSILIHNCKKVFKAYSLEISPGGAGIKIENVDFKLDQELFLHFRPSNDVPAFNAICKIVSKSENKFGVQFSSITAVAKESIAKLIKKAA